MEALKKLKAVALEAAEDDCQCGADIDSDHSVGECYWHQIIRLADEATLEARPSTGEAEALRALLAEGACFAESQRHRTKGVKGKEQAFKVADEYLGRLEASLQRDKTGR